MKPSTLKIKAAQQHIRTHIQTKGHHTNFSITEALCKYWWRKLNDSVFGGILKMPTAFIMRRFKGDTYGWCQPEYMQGNFERRVSIGINRTIQNRKMFLSILVHEMVHQWEWEVDQTWSNKSMHGHRFMAWADYIKAKTNLPLQKTY